MSDNLLEERNKLKEYRETPEEKEQRIEEAEEKSYYWDKVKKWSNQQVFADECIVIRYNHFPDTKERTQSKFKELLLAIKAKYEELKSCCPAKLVWKTNLPVYVKNKGGIFKVTFRNPYDLLVFKKFTCVYVEELMVGGFHAPISLEKTPMKKDTKPYKEWYKQVKFPQEEMPNEEYKDF